MHTLNSDPDVKTPNPAPAPSRPQRNRLILWLVLGLCAAPVVASFVAYYWLRPSGHVNYGELLTPQPMPAAALSTLDGKPFRWSDLDREWVLVIADSAACDQRCREKLIYTRQVRLAQGKESERVERVWLLTDGGTPEAALVADHPGLHVVRADGSEALRILPAKTSPAAHVYVVDPLGNLMMRFPENADPRRMLKDLSRLLRHSQWR
jgi:hypothetical protein